MSEHFVVETNRIAAGVAVRVPGGFRFFSADPRFGSLDGHIFRKARALFRQVGEIGKVHRSREALTRST